MNREVQPVKNGFYKRWGSNSNFTHSECPLCKIDMTTIADLYEEPNPDICIEWSEKKQSMESEFYQCPICKKIFVYWESGDYDNFYLQEVSIRNFSSPLIIKSRQKTNSDFNPSIRRMGTKVLRELIPSWVTDSEVERLRKEFENEIDFQELKDAMTKASNWRRSTKYQNGSEIVRVFNCTPYDDQLRVYVYTDKNEMKVLSLRFEAE